MNRKPCIVLLFSLVVLVFNGCGDEEDAGVEDVVLAPNPHEDTQAELNQNRSRWESKGLTNYRFGFGWICECSGLTERAVTVTVRNGVMFSVLVFRTDLKFLDQFVEGERIPQDLHSEFVRRELARPEVVRDGRLVQPQEDPPISRKKYGVWSMITDIDKLTYIATAEDGQLNVYYDASPSRYRRYHTIEDLFDLVQEAIDGIPFEGVTDFIRVDYDSEFGYPTESLMDYDEESADEETHFFVTNFTVLE